MHKITTVSNDFTTVIINMFANNRMSCVSSKWQKKAAACFGGGSLREEHKRANMIHLKQDSTAN